MGISKDIEGGHWASELITANKELAFQNDEKEKRAAELVIANKELTFQNDEKEKRAAELVIANIELAFQGEEKGKRAAELVIADRELAFQNDEKADRAAELVIANKELTFQNDEKADRAAELVIADKELAFQNDEKEKRAAELVIANIELTFQNDEKEKRAVELIIANKELAFQNDEKEKRAAELVIANKELAFQNDEKEKRAAELIIANKELAGIAEITALCQGVQDFKTLAQLLITKIPPMVEASYGVFYIKKGNGDKQCLQRLASYAGGPLDTTRNVFWLGEGLVGQSALENRTIVLDQVAKGYIKITSGLGETSPTSIVILPVAYEEQVVAVLELAFLQPCSPLQQDFLEQVCKTIGVTINRVKDHMKIEELLKESQVFTEELQTQSEELQLQQEELKKFNEKLEEQYKHSEQRAEKLETMKVDLEQKARQLEDSSAYKTEFLSNMSHELRTPLNSLLILSQILTENQEGNLTPNQVEYVKTIFSSGNELLALINDILDLSKIEAGKLSMNPAVVELSEVKNYVERYFHPVAHQKELNFIVQMDEGLPDTICMDELRLLQILKNLLANAFKFTVKGTISLRIQRAEEHVVAKNALFLNAKSVLAFSVTDTGIGIPKHKQDLIFEAFQQANGTTARKYGGTGLGLTISQNIARLLGGFIELDSDEDMGSTFTLYVPSQSLEKEISQISWVEAAVTADDSTSYETEPVEALATVVRAADESSGVENGTERLEGKKILVVDDDMRNVFALTAALENRNMQAVFAENGREGIEVLQKNQDIDLVLMDIMMPEMDGYEAIQRIRQIPEYASLPIIALTAKAMKNDREKCIQAGASDYIGKPVNLEQLFSLIKIWLYR